MIDVAFVSGSTGKIGKELVQVLKSKNILVVGLGKFQSNSSISIKVFDYNIQKFEDYISIPNNEWIEYEKDKLIELFDFIKTKQINSYFFHLAWGGLNSLTDGGYDKQIDNVGISSNYLDLSKKIGVKKFINLGSIDEIYVKRCLENKQYDILNEFNHLDYGIAKLAVKDILSFKSYVEKIDFIHTQTSIVISPDLENDTFVEKNLKKILKNNNFDIPENKELCNISTTKQIAENLLTLSEFGENQKTYYTGGQDVYSLKNYFVMFDNYYNKKKENEIKDNSIKILKLSDFDIPKIKSLKKISFDDLLGSINLI